MRSPETSVLLNLATISVAMTLKINRPHDCVACTRLHATHVPKRRVESITRGQKRGDRQAAYGVRNFPPLRGVTLDGLLLLTNVKSIPGSRVDASISSRKLDASSRAHRFGETDYYDGIQCEERIVPESTGWTQSFAMWPSCDLAAGSGI